MIEMINRNNWWHWPLSKEGLIEYNEPKRARKRILIFSIIFGTLAGILFYHKAYEFGLLLILGISFSWVLHFKINNLIAGKV